MKVWICLYLYVLCFAMPYACIAKIVVAGATGYIGRNVVRVLCRAGVPTIALVRDVEGISDYTRTFLEGAELVVANPIDLSSMLDIYAKHKPEASICCLASRNGLPRDSWVVDYEASRNVFLAQCSTRRPNEKPHFVLLSAFCCGKPSLQFQYAKLKLENEIVTSGQCSYSIVRPTAYFKSLDGQIENLRKGYPLLYFGDGKCAANAISEVELAEFLAQCSLKPQAMKMLNQIRNLGGPDNPPISKRDQIQMMFDIFDIPEDKQRSFSLPVGILDGLIKAFGGLQTTSSRLGMSRLEDTFENAVEIVKIIRYYAVEPMVAIEKDEIYGQKKLKDHFLSIAARGGKLEEIDKMTTTTGVLELIAKNEYTNTK